MTVPVPAGAPVFTAFLIAGEESGDVLGAGLMEAMRARLGGKVRFVGVGGERMATAGLRSLFPMSEVNHHGITAIIANVRKILRLMRSTARAVVEAKPDVLVIIDVPGFNLGVARRVRKWAPSIPIVEYVSPTVWVWRPGRARWMKPFVDHVLAILPFEPEAHRRLGGPPCTYVGHPLAERLAGLRPAPGERAPLGPSMRPVVLVLAGSRTNELERLTGPFGEAVARVVERLGPVELLMPAVPRFADELRRRTDSWKVKPTIVTDEVGKLAAFRRAHAALAASGTVTLELALAGVPMVVAYRVDPLAKLFKPIVMSRLRSIVLPNLILDENAIPEFLDADGTPERLAEALLPLLRDTPERRAQIAAFDRLDAAMSTGDRTPSDLAAGIVLDTATRAAERRP